MTPPSRPDSRTPRPRRPLTRTDLVPLARAAFGPGRTLDGVRRLRGGSKKGVYRLTLDDGSTAVAYVWSDAEDYWDQPATDPRDPFSPGTGLGLFTAAHDRLTEAGVRTPRLRYADATHRHLPADAAVVEDLTGGSLEDALARDPGAAGRLMARTAELLATLHSRTGPRLGKVAVVDGGGSSHPGTCAERVAEGALRCVADAARREPRVAAARRELEDTVHALAAEVRPRDRHTLVHGELGPDHVLLTRDGHPALIDIEGLTYCDVEQEHVFLELRFGPHYQALRVPGLDEARLRLYRLSMHLGLVSGPLTLAEGDFPHPERMREIAEHNLRQALSLLRSAF
ncbi:phosphotransferase family protein [Streptomyces sp. NPDC058947]|uniref:phosphotransferase family protein n=1 Tax=Streptomyces sp. NPDC058947 TaxID=3346675 RepID=UPI0036CB292E